MTVKHSMVDPRQAVDVEGNVPGWWFDGFAAYHHLLQHPLSQASIEAFRALYMITVQVLFLAWWLACVLPATAAA